MAKDEKSKDMFETLARLRKKYLADKQYENDLYLKRDAEIEKAIEMVTQKFDKRIKQTHQDADVSRKELNDFDKLIFKYSTFDTKLLCETLQQLVSIVECEEYSCQEATYVTKRRMHGPIDHWDEDVHKQVKLIIRGSEKSGQYRSSNEYDTEIMKLVKEGQAILLSEEENFYRINFYRIQDNEKNITFYSANDGEVKCLVDFGRFDYVKEFIDRIMQYRFQNNLEEITKKDLLEFMRKFVSSHGDLIASNHQLRITEQQGKLQRKIEEAQRELDAYNVEIRHTNVKKKS